MATIINLDEKIGKWVGRHPAEADPFVAYEKLRSLGAGIRPFTAYPKGVFRFKTHEEADAWRWSHIIRTATRR